MEDDDLRADLEAAMAGETTGDVVEAPAPLTAIASEPAVETQPVGETAEQRQARIDATGRAHDEKGKFTAKPKEEGGKPPAVEPENAEAKTPDATTKHQPPSHWKPEAKAAFLEAPEHVQKQILEREEDMEKGRREWSTKAEEYNQIKPVIDGQRDRWALLGMTPGVAIQRLLQAEQALQNDPAKGIEFLLTNYHKGNELGVINAIISKHGYSLTRATNQGEQPQEGQPPAQVDPTVRRLQEDVQKLTQELSARKEQEVNASRADMAAQVEAVRKDPKNLYFENVKDVVAALTVKAVNSGDRRPTKDIVQEAYDSAVWANATTRQLLLAQQTKDRDAEAARQAAAKVAAAQQASGSITGSPGPGTASARPANGATPNRNLDDDIRADLMEALSAGRA